MDISNKLSEAEQLAQLASPGPSGSDTRVNQAPEDWRPRMDVDQRTGGFIVAPARPAGETTPSTDELLREFGLDPAEWSVTSMRRGRWQRYDGEYLESVRVNLAPAGALPMQTEDLEKLVDEVKKWRPEKGVKKYTGDGAYAVFPSDQQLGKKANGIGSAESVQKILGVTEGAVQRLAGLNKYGLGFSSIVLGLLGDHVEGNTSQNGRLQGQAASDLGLTEQVRVARRLLMAQIKAFAPLTDRVVVAVINGNHDEVTRQVAADPADGWNVEIASAVQDACAENPALAHVEFRFPASGHQTLTINVEGTMLGMFHGHQARGGKALDYIKGQSAGMTALGMADVWVSGHYHNFASMDIGHRLWCQCPTTDPGSEWFRDRAGLESKPGLLTMVLGGSHDPREFISVVPVR